MSPLDKKHERPFLAHNRNSASIIAGSKAVRQNLLRRSDYVPQQAYLCNIQCRFKHQPVHAILFQIENAEHISRAP